MNVQDKAKLSYYILFVSEKIEKFNKYHNLFIF